MTRHTWTICSVCLSAHTGQLPLSFIPYRRLQLDDVTLAKRLLMITPKEAIQWKAWLWWRFWQERNIGYKNCLHCLVIAWVFRVNTRFLLPLLFSLYAPVFNCKLIYFTFSQRFEILYIIHVTSTFKWDALKKAYTSFEFVQKRHSLMYNLKRNHLALYFQQIKGNDYNGIYHLIWKAITDCTGLDPT